MKIDEPNTIHERIEALINHYCKGNKTAFGRETDILPGVLASIVGGRMSKPSFELLQKIITRYPAVNGNWLIVGRGPMLDLGSESLVLVDVLDGFSPETIKQVIKDHKEQGERLEKAEEQIFKMQEWAQKLMSVNIPAKMRDALKLPDNTKPKE